MCTTISPEDFDFIENELKFDDKVSLLFILYGHRNPKYLLQALSIGSQTPEEETHILFDLTSCAANDEWQSEILEALAIIQANLCLLKCGFDETDLKERFLPHLTELASFVHPVLKGLYLLCEKLDDRNAEKLLNYLKQNYSFSVVDHRYFEMALLDLLCHGLIKLGSALTGEECDLLILTAAFKTLELYELSEFCKTIANNFNKELVLSRNQSDNVKESQVFKQIPEVQSKDELQDIYYISKQNAGIILIINQFTFYRETNQELAEMLPIKPLNNRRGTEVDKLAILNLFRAFGYNTIVVENITHTEIMKQVESAVNEIKSCHCSLVVCLLSHGQEGKVYGSNSIPVSVKSIEKVMAAEKLTGKPKLLFVQACQGSDLQAAVEIPRLEKDGPSTEKTASVFVDFLVAWSTVPGFASVRHIEKGSWFIQELCLKLRQLHARNHLMDILTAVINDVSSKRGYGNECMVPIIYSTLRKKLHFEPLDTK
ncbi:caspase-8-like [Topomyia yanbarensis]|uniref:caspase-8-like n=1 Tax=Topomyia yanbarensis TaxID=2498891 RepID=UPI00273AB283|nr:caspase-8-like [Topomyia yanbarensis]